MQLQICCKKWSVILSENFEIVITMTHILPLFLLKARYLQRYTQRMLSIYLGEKFLRQLKTKKVCKKYSLRYCSLTFLLSCSIDWERKTMLKCQTPLNILRLYITLILMESTLSYITKCSIEHQRARFVYV